MVANRNVRQQRGELTEMKYTAKPAVKTFEQTTCTYGNMF